MNRKQWYFAAKHGTYCFVMLILYVLQNTPGFLTMMGVKPNLIIPAAIGIAMLEGEYAGGLYGVFAGILCDVGGSGLFGFNAIILLIAGVVAGLLAIYMLRMSVINYILLLSGALATRALLDYLLNYAMWKYENIWMLLVYRMIPGIIYTAAISPLVYYLLKWLFEWFGQRLDA